MDLLIMKVQHILRLCKVAFLGPFRTINPMTSKQINHTYLLYFIPAERYDVQNGKLPGTPSIPTDFGSTVTERGQLQNCYVNNNFTHNIYSLAFPFNKVKVIDYCKSYMQALVFTHIDNLII